MMNKKILYPLLALIVLGICVRFSVARLTLNSILSAEYYYILNAVQPVFLGIFLMYVFAKLDFNRWAKIAKWLVAASFLALIPAIFLGTRHAGAGAYSMINFGIFGLNTGEFTKFAALIFLARYFSNKAETRTGILKNLLIPGIIYLGYYNLLLLQRDFSAILIITVLYVAVYFTAAAKRKHAWIFVGYLGFLFSLMILSYPSRFIDKATILFNPWADPNGSAYQLVQSLIAIGSNGLWGSGIGNSLQKYSYLPGCRTDTIFAIFAEECGLIGVGLLLVLYFWIFYQIVKVAVKSNEFGRLLCLGFSILFMVPIVFHIGAVAGVLPFMGVRLPFVSYGSNNIMFLLAGFGIIMNISKQSGLVDNEGVLLNSGQTRKFSVLTAILFSILFLRIIYIQTVMAKTKQLGMRAFNRHFVVTPDSLAIDSDSVVSVETSQKDYPALQKIYKANPGATERELFKAVKSLKTFKLCAVDSSARLIPNSPYNRAIE
ncbi:MAG: FtsW/RodA/SpoVE family cell cycle protein [Candidatus Saccharimonadaceae bacterium]|nr:FtsW/RodA/SpoVE family cell cycle protein [Candidatus Saccharimonadaceae bacterium]